MGKEWKLKYKFKGKTYYSPKLFKSKKSATKIGRQLKKQKRAEFFVVE